MTRATNEMIKGNVPTLSVVVPIFNVEEFLDECLQSIASQEVESFETILVDDGSTDGSSAIADRWAEKDSRFRVVRQTNHGLGHARNTGVDHARGEYLAFLDSDDLASKNAYRVMIDTLARTRSDFATGMVYRFNSFGSSPSPYFKGIATRERLSTHVSEYWELLRDHLAPNKVWRTSFWRNSGIKFPVGVFYEDVPTIIPLHVLAKAVDVVPVVSTLWRKRQEGNTSITQNRRADAAHVRDRLAAVLSNSRFIGEHVGKDLKADYERRVLGMDVRVHLDFYPEVDDEYRSELISSVARFVDQIEPEALADAPANLRIAYTLAARGALDDLETLIKMRRAKQIGELPVQLTDGRAFLDLDLPQVKTLPDSVRDVTDELSLATKVSDLRVDDGELVIGGWAYIRRLPVDVATRQEIAVWLDRDGKRIQASVEYRRDERAAADAGWQRESSGRTAFTARIPIRKLHRRWPLRGAEWKAMVSVTQDGLTREDFLRGPLAGPAQRPNMVRLHGANWLRVSWVDDVLTCRVRAETAIVVDANSDGDSFDFTIETNKPVRSDAQARIKSRHSGDGVSVGVEKSAGSRRRVTVAFGADVVPGLAEVGASGDGLHYWDILFRPAKSEPWRRVLDPSGWVGDSIDVDSGSLALRRSQAANYGLANVPVSPLLTHAEWSRAGTLSLRLSCRGVGPSAVVLVSRQGDHVEFPATSANGVLTADMDLVQVPRFGRTFPVRSGTWDIAVRIDDRHVPVRLGRDALELLPLRSVELNQREFRLTDRDREKLSLVVESDLGATERGSVNQKWLQTVVYPNAKAEIRDAVLYESYWGKQFSDSPRAIFDELRSRGDDLEHLVVVRDQQVAVPEGAVAVPYRSERYYRALSQSRYIVANTHLLTCFSKAPGQTVVQTWHGVGTKKIGLDLKTIHFANKSYNDRLRGGEADNWDYLISPNPFTSPILSRAFAFRGTLLETGVPRNDIFHRADSARIASDVRRKLGVRDDQKIVLYAPTWRDDLRFGGRYRLDLRFDMYAASRKLGEDYAFIFRKHSNVSDRLPPGDGHVIDASDYPDVQELLVAADILVSDYSTLMCDFANTGRPMLFYTYDLANYRDVLRGFYFDFENEVPGPLITDESDLLSAIGEADGIRAQYDDKYKAFANRFCVWDDGSAAFRVVDRIFGGPV